MEPELDVKPLHRAKEYLMDCCKLINSEWPRSDTARLRSLESSCDNLPTCLILLRNKRVVGHCKLSRIPSEPKACFLESVVISKSLRGLGLGTYLMNGTEKYCKDKLQLHTVYLSTKGQELFYNKLGYIECEPISLYGGYTNNHVMQKIFPQNQSKNYLEAISDQYVKSSSFISGIKSQKTFMKKKI